MDEKMDSEHVVAFIRAQADLIMCLEHEVSHLAGLEVSLADYKNANEHLADDCLAKDAEIARLQSRLAAADALLRECLRYLDPRQYSALIKKLDTHLSEKPHELP